MAIDQQFHEEFEKIGLPAVRLYLAWEQKTMANLTSKGYAAMEYIFEREQLSQTRTRQISYCAFAVSTLALLLALAKYLQG